MTGNCSICPLKVSAKVTVILHLSLLPLLDTCFELFSAIVTLSLGTNLDGVWSTFKISSSGISSSTISCRNVAFTSSQVAFVMAGLEVVTILQVDFILWYRDCNQPLVITKFKYWPYLSEIWIQPLELVFFASSRYFATQGCRVLSVRFGKSCLKCFIAFMVPWLLAYLSI